MYICIYACCFMIIRKCFPGDLAALARRPRLAALPRRVCLCVCIYIYIYIYILRSYHIRLYHNISYHIILYYIVLYVYYGCASPTGGRTTAAPPAGGRLAI